MTRPEARFKSAVLALIWQGIYPGPVQLRRWLGRTDGSRSINGRETQWRREVLRSRGWTVVTSRAIGRNKGSAIAPSVEGSGFPSRSVSLNGSSSS